MEKLQSQQENPSTEAEDETTENTGNRLEGPITREQDIRNKLEYLGIPFSEEFLTGNRYDELQNEHGIVQWYERQRMNKRLRLYPDILETANFGILQYIYYGLQLRPSFRNRVRSRIRLAELKGIPKGDPATPEELEQTRLELAYTRMKFSPEDLTREERKSVSRMAVQLRKDRMAKYGNPYKNGLKSNHETMPVPAAALPPSHATLSNEKSPGIPKVTPNLIAHTMFKPSADTIIKPANPWEKLATTPERSSAVATPEDDSKAEEANKPTEEESQLSPLPLSLSSDQRRPTHTVRHNRKVREKKARKMKRLAQSLASPADSIAEPPAQSGSLSQLCPHPHKKNYVTVELAEEFMRETHPDEPTINVYQCKCGGIHIGRNNIRNPSEKIRLQRKQEREQENALNTNRPVTKSGPSPHDIFMAAQRKKNQEKKDA